MKKWGYYIGSAALLGGVLTLFGLHPFDENAVWFWIIDIPAIIYLNYLFMGDRETKSKKLKEPKRLKTD